MAVNLNVDLLSVRLSTNDTLVALVGGAFMQLCPIN